MRPHSTLSRRASLGGFALCLLSIHAQNACVARTTPREPLRESTEAPQHAGETTRPSSGPWRQDSTSHARAGGARQERGAAAVSYATPLEQLGAPPHELVVQALLEDDSVIPRRPPVHPVRALYNREAIVPPMCYTRTEGVHNPCYVCHQDQVPGRPNAMNDGDLQAAYSFSELGQTNHHTNLFVDRTPIVAAIPDAEIDAWVNVDNYSALAPRLREAGFRGYVPDLDGLAGGAQAFDELGFANDGSHWVAFNYKPLPSTFWPTNGAMDDVMIRLPEAFRVDVDGAYSRDVYLANLALVEANIKGMRRISVPELDERRLGADLDGDGRLGTIRELRDQARYVGKANAQPKVPYLFPVDTEFLHSVRYLGVGPRGEIVTPPRMKELRYMKKRFFRSVAHLAEEYRREGYAKDAGDLPGYIDRGHHGFDNDMGWVIAGFIENKRGELRVNSYEETMYCMGCHGSVGSSIDSVFSFARKVDGAAGFGYVDLRGMPDAPNLGETQGEILTYLERAGGGGEFRSNPEMEQRWFAGGAVDRRAVHRARDVHQLITPSPERARALNKAYLAIVREQSFIYGRDASIGPPANVYQRVDNEHAPTLPPERTFLWDIRLDWGSALGKRATRPRNEPIARTGTATP